MISRKLVPLRERYSLNQRVRDNILLAMSLGLPNALGRALYAENRIINSGDSVPEYAERVMRNARAETALRWRKHSPGATGAHQAGIPTHGLVRTCRNRVGCPQSAETRWLRE